MTSLSTFTALVVMVLAFSLLLASSETATLEDGWYGVSTRQAVASRSRSVVSNRITAAVEDQVWLRRLPCLPAEANIEDWPVIYGETSPQAVLPGAVFLAISVLETEARGPVRRRLEVVAARALGAVGLSYPDWTYGPMQISIPAARSVVSDEISTAELFRDLTDDCAHSRTAMQLLARYTESCTARHGTREAAILACIARRYNGPGQQSYDLGLPYAALLNVAYREVFRSSSYEEIEPALARARDDFQEALEDELANPDITASSQPEQPATTRPGTGQSAVASRAVDGETRETPDERSVVESGGADLDERLGAIETHINRLLAQNDFIVQSLQELQIVLQVTPQDPEFDPVGQPAPRVSIPENNGTAGRQEGPFEFVVPNLPPSVLPPIETLASFNSARASWEGGDAAELQNFADANPTLPLGQKAADLLQYGVSGENFAYRTAATELQTILQAEGCGISDVDGIFGPNSEGAYDALRIVLQGRCGTLPVVSRLSPNDPAGAAWIGDARRAINGLQNCPIVRSAVRICEAPVVDSDCALRSGCLFPQLDVGFGANEFCSRYNRVDAATWRDRFFEEERFGSLFVTVQTFVEDGVPLSFEGALEEFRDLQEAHPTLAFQLSPSSGNGTRLYIAQLAAGLDSLIVANEIALYARFCIRPGATQVVSDGAFVSRRGSGTVGLLRTAVE